MVYPTIEEVLIALLSAIKGQKSAINARRSLGLDVIHVILE